MERTVAARLVFRTVADTKAALAIAVARNPGYTSFDESLSVTVGGEPVRLTELPEHHGGRLHYMEFADPSEVTVEYSATVTGQALPEEVAPDIHQRCRNRGADPDFPAGVLVQSRVAHVTTVRGRSCFACVPYSTTWTSFQNAT